MRALFADSSSVEKTNDDLLYDPEEDDENAKWVHQMQKDNQGGSLEGGSTDAILNCPGCMTLLSLNCQRYWWVPPSNFYKLLQKLPLRYCVVYRHSKYKTQYRTVFTFNCKVEKSEILHLPAESQSSDLSKVIDRASDRKQTESDDKFHRVLCEICDTPVGLRDSVGVYHLFGVLASHS